MIQAAERSSTVDASPSAGKLDEITPGSTGKVDRNSSRPVSGTTGTFYLNEGGGGWRAEILQEIVSNDVDRLDAVMGRAADLKRLLNILMWAPDMNDSAQAVLTVIGREVDAIYAIAVQPSLTVEYVS